MWGWGGFQEPGVTVGVKDALGHLGCVFLYGRLELDWKAGEGPGHGAGAGTGLSRPPSIPPAQSPLLTSHWLPLRRDVQKGFCGWPRVGAEEDRREGREGEELAGPRSACLQGEQTLIPTPWLTAWHSGEPLSPPSPSI